MHRERLPALSIASTLSRAGDWVRVAGPGAALSRGVLWHPAAQARGVVRPSRDSLHAQADSDLRSCAHAIDRHGAFPGFCSSTERSPPI